MENEGLILTLKFMLCDLISCEYCMDFWNNEKFLPEELWFVQWQESCLIEYKPVTSCQFIDALLVI